MKASNSVTKQIYASGSIAKERYITLKIVTIGQNVALSTVNLGRQLLNAPGVEYTTIDRSTPRAILMLARRCASLNWKYVDM